MEKETDGTLPFLDVKIEKDTNKFLTFVYKKPTFIGQTHVGTCLDLPNAKLTSLAHLFKEP